MQTLHFLFVLFGSLSLPFLALLAVVLRRSLVTGKMRLLVLFSAVIGLLYVILEEFLHHGAEFGKGEALTALIVALVTLFLLSRSHSHHAHGIGEQGIQGVIVAESFHSIFDGIALGVAFLASPAIGFGALGGIILHELPKMVATLALMRSSGLSATKTLLYGALSQAGAPAAAIFVYLLGVSIESEFHIADAAVLSSLATVVLYIIYKEISFHKKHTQHEHAEGEHGHTH